jgi:phosphatidylserine decarboxylase
MKEIVFLDRETKKITQEKVYGEACLQALYGDSFFSKILEKTMLPLLSKYPFASKLYGALQKSSFSKKKVKPFIKDFEMDSSEFLDSVDSFGSFNEFFIRKLKPGARKIVTGRDVAILPADARYLVYPNIEKSEGFLVKGKKFTLENFLQSKELAAKYAQGSMLIARLCPTDYHRFHFPFNCMPSSSELINGYLYSVNPIALRKRIEIFSENKRELTTLRTQQFGEVIFVEVGATNVGSIHQTFTPEEPYAKGDEKGYFSFGGSSLVLLFEPGKIQFDQDLVDASAERIEVRGLMGQSLGRALSL